MKRHCGRIMALSLLLVLALGCGHRGRVIPEDKFADIYADMLLADQWLSSNPKARRVADTTLFYAPILESYGYNVLDYNASVRHYMKKPEKFAAIISSSSKQLSAYAKRLQAVEDEMKSRYKLPPYKKVDFSRDTVLVVDTSKVLSSQADTLDSAIELADSAGVAAAEPDTVNTIIQSDTTNYERKGNFEEMFLLHGPDDTTSGRYRGQRERVGRKSNKIAF